MQHSIIFTEPPQSQTSLSQKKNPFQNKIQMKNMVAKRILNVDRVNIFVLDEADVMLDQET